MVATWRLVVTDGGIPSFGLDKYYHSIWEELLYNITDDNCLYPDHGKVDALPSNLWHNGTTSHTHMTLPAPRHVADTLSHDALEKEEPPVGIQRVAGHTHGTFFASYPMRGEAAFLPRGPAFIVYLCIQLCKHLSCSMVFYGRVLSGPAVNLVDH